MRYTKCGYEEYAEMDFTLEIFFGVIWEYRSSDAAEFGSLRV